MPLAGCLCILHVGRGRGRIRGSKSSRGRRASDRPALAGTQTRSAEFKQRGASIHTRWRRGTGPVLEAHIGKCAGALHRTSHLPLFGKPVTAAAVKAMPMPLHNVSLVDVHEAKLRGLET